MTMNKQNDLGLDLRGDAVGDTSTPDVPSGTLSASTTITASSPRITGALNSASWTIPLHVTVTIGTPKLMTAAAPAPAVAISAVAGREGVSSRAAPVVAAGRFDLGSLSSGQFDWKAALSCALASKLAYEEGPVVRDTTTGSWGFQDCEFLDRDNTQCFVAWSSDVALVSFRGTASVGDWLANLNLFSTTRSYGTVHRGFLGAFQVVESDLQTLLRPLSGRTLVVTGHSLGGALATIAAAEWEDRFSISFIYTYGQPAVGKGTFPASIDGHYPGKFFRFVNDDDVVPRVPPTYRHVGKLFHFDANGNLEDQLESAAVEAANRVIAPVFHSPENPPIMTEAEFDRMRAQLLEEKLRARSAGTESMQGPALEGILPSVSDHAIDRYIAKVAAKAASA
jgi:hypothetical protein